MNTTKLTDAQTRNLEIIRAAGGVIVSKMWDWTAPDSSAPIRGLNGKALAGLARAGRIRAYDLTGLVMSPNSVLRPARYEVVAP